MARRSKLAVILHADIVGSTALVQKDERLAHDRIQDVFRRFGDTISKYHGHVRELRGDALLAEFARASDAVTASLAFQSDQIDYNSQLKDNIRPTVRVGIAMGEVIIADDTITGTGVVLAQRLEQLSKPGGVVIQGAAYETIPGRFPFEYDDQGEQEVKGFDKPIRVYSVNLKSSTDIPQPSPLVRSTRNMIVAVTSVAIIITGIAMMWLKPWKVSKEPVFVEHEVLPLPDKPSIAVLPFTNMSDDTSQEYFVDGMTEDLITDLAKIESLFVIARNTVFTFKGKSVAVPDVARELGVKYVLEGSVRRVGDKVRINSQLIDGTSGSHIWAERYDGTLADIFALQDEVTSEIVAQLQITLTPDEQTRRTKKGTENPDAHDAYLRGWQFYRRYTPEDFVEAIPHLEQATELDPDYGQAWAALASIYWITYQKKLAWSLIVNPDKGMVNSNSWVGSLVKAENYLRQAMRDPTPLAYQIESQLSTDYRQFDKALSESEQAVTLDPNDPEGHKAMAWALIFAGRAEEALTSAENGMRLDPYYPAPHLYALGTAHLMLKQYTQAEAALKRALGLDPENKNLLLPLASAYGQLEKQEEARATLKQYEQFIIYWTPKIETYMQWWPFRREADIRLFGGGLIKAGLCCDDQLEVHINRLRQGGTLE